MVTLSDSEVALVAGFMAEACGIDLRGKEYLIRGKIGLLCAKLGVEDASEFLSAACANTREGATLRQRIIDSLTTNYTYFCREEDHFALVQDLVRSGELPVGAGVLRCWSAGCAFGQEPYNLAMCLEEAREQGILTVPYEIAASDISSEAVKQARLGCYSATDYARLPPRWREKYCLRTGDGCEVRPLIRRHVSVRLENLLKRREPMFYDLVLCRNLLIYFNPESIRRLIAVLAQSLLPGGYLLLGHADILTNMPGFTYIQPMIYRKEN